MSNRLDDFISKLPDMFLDNREDTTIYLTSKEYLNNRQQISNGKYKGFKIVHDRTN